MAIPEPNYRKDTLHTYKVRFQHDGERIEEYIHCFVIEWNEPDKFGRPTILTVRQIHDLQQYLLKKKGKTTVRILKIEELDPVFSFSVLHL